MNLQGNQFLAKENIMLPINYDKFNIVNTEHLMCKDCTYIFKGKVTEMMKTGAINKTTENVPIACCICGMDHSIKVKAFKSASKENEVSCCLIC